MIIRLFLPFSATIIVIFLFARLYYIAEAPAPHDSIAPELPPPEKDPNYVSHAYNETAYREIFSVSTSDKKYFKIDFHPFSAINPNAIPHPHLANTWIIVAQLKHNFVKEAVWFAELSCAATFSQGGTLSCIDPPLILSIGKTPGSEKCTGDLGWFKLSIGPHDARVFYGPSTPYAIYGSNSQYTCYGLWMQDFRVLMDWPFEFFDPEQFRVATELQRPEPYSPVEKNYFVFWDDHENIYAHYDILPRRSFAKLSYDGSVGPDLAPLAAARDDKCMAKYMPKFLDVDASIHQATNSISVTLCKRSECKPNNSNTFILTIFQKKKTYGDDGFYDPYVMLFQRDAPFALHAISTKPFWISGRGKPGEWNNLDGSLSDRGQMMYVTSVSWKAAGQKYHGYIDDILFLLFGIEDNDTAGIDIRAADLLADLGLCASS